MQRLLRLTKTLSILSLCSGCAIAPKLPPPPEGSTCIVDVANDGADCVTIAAVAQHMHERKVISINVEDLHHLVDSYPRANVFVPFNSMDNYVAFSPETWANVQQYIGDLKVIIQDQCGQ